MCTAAIVAVKAQPLAAALQGVFFAFLCAYEPWPYIHFDSGDDRGGAHV
jgi:hypothetical protein